MTRLATTNERQPSRLPFVLRVVLWGLVVACVALGGGAKVRAQDGDIRVVAVDSSRVPEPDGPDAGKPVPRPIRDGVAEVVSAINEGGGLLGRRLTVTYENDRCEAEEAARVASRAVEHGAHVVIGHVCSSGAIRAAAIYAEAGVLMIATGPRHPRFTSPSGRRGVFRLAGRDDRQAQSIAALIAARFPDARMAIVHDQSLQGRGMADEVRRSAIAAKAAPLLVAPYLTGTKDYAALVAQLVEAKIDLVVFCGHALEASIILDQARDAGLRIATAIGTDGFAADAPPERLLAATREFLVMLPWPGQSRGVGAGAGVGEVGGENTRKPAGAALEVWVQAVGRVRSLTVETVGEALKSGSTVPGIGAVRFDENGDAVVPSFMPHVWREGRWQVRE